MSTLPTVDAETSSSTGAHAPSGRAPLLVCLPSMASDATAAVLAELAHAFAGQPLLVATPDHDAEQPAVEGRPHLVPYPEPRTEGEWVLGGGDYLAAARLAEERHAGAVLLLGTDAASLHPGALESMRAGLAGGADLALPQYRTAPDDGLANSALLYPLTRALFGADIRFPLPLDAGVSPRMLSRLASSAARLGTQGGEQFLWPVAEASVAGLIIRQVEGGARVLPQPQEADLNTLFPAVTASLFADLEARATYWQRARAVPATRPIAARARSPLAPGASEEVRSLVDNYRAAFDNLREIWALVLPPQSLLALKKMAVSSPENFNFSPALWARTVYDFALAFHLRTLNRGHLLGALTPLYLAWVASFLRTAEIDSGGAPELLEITANAFEQEKPYLVSRWRWPDRFNP